MFSKMIRCTCQDVGCSSAAAERTTNFEIVRYKPLKERLSGNYKYPTFTYKYIEDIKVTLRESCNFERIKEVLYYLEMNPDIHDIVPELLQFISCELKKEDQQRAPILLKALYCLYTNSVSAVSDFSVCTNALEHFLTKSSTFPGDYVLKDIAADILSDFCAMSPSDDLKKHFILQLSRVFHNPNWHSYNLYGGIVGCLSNMSAKSGPELVPYDAFNSNTFLRHVLSSPKMLQKLFHLCKPFIYNFFPSRLIPRPLHNENSFYDVNTSCAGVFNLLRNEMITPISYVKYDHKFLAHYEFEGGWFDDPKWSNLPADCPRKDLIHPGLSAYQKEKMLKKHTESEMKSQICAESEGSISCDESEKNLEVDCKSNNSANSNEDLQNLEIDSKSNNSANSNEDLQNSEIDRKSNGSINSNKSIENSQTDCKSDGYLYFTRRESSSLSGHKSDGYIENFKKKNSDFDRSVYTKMWLDKYGDNAKCNEKEMNPSIDRESDGGLDLNWGASCSRPGRSSDSYGQKYKKRKYSDFDRKSDFKKRWLDKYGGSAKCSKSERDPLIDRVSDACVGRSNETQISALGKQNIQRDFSEGDTGGIKSEENLQIKKERKLCSLNRTGHRFSRKKIDVKGPCKQDVHRDSLKGNTDASNSGETFQVKNEWELQDINQRRLQVSLKKIDWKFDDNMDTTDHETNPQVGNEDKDEKGRKYDSNVKPCKKGTISHIGTKCMRDTSKSNEREDDFQIKSKSGEDNSENEPSFTTKSDRELNTCETDRKSRTGCISKDVVKSSESFPSLPLISLGKLGDFQIGDKSESDINSSMGEGTSQIKSNNDFNSSKGELISCIDYKSNEMDIEVKNLQDGNKSRGDVTKNETERNLEIDSKCDDDDDTDITVREKNIPCDNKSNENVKNSESEMDLPFYIIFEGRVESTNVIDVGNELRANCNPVEKGDMDASNSGRNSQAISQPGLIDREQDDSKCSEHTKFKTNEEVMRNVDSQRAKRLNDRAETKSTESPAFRNLEEYREFLAWKSDRSLSESYKPCYIGNTFKRTPPPAKIDRSMFQHYEVEDFVPDTHVISSSYITEESLAAAHHNCCQRSNACEIPSAVNPPPPDLDIFKNLDKNMFANWEFKKPKSKKESPGAEKSETRGQLQKKYKNRGGRKR